MEKIELTEKEIKAFRAIVDNAMEACMSHGSTPKDLHKDNYSWFDRQTITERTGFSKHEASGLMSSLDDKNLICEYDDGEWAISDYGIDIAEEIFPNYTF